VNCYNIVKNFYATIISKNESLKIKKKRKLKQLSTLNNKSKWDLASSGERMLKILDFVFLTIFEKLIKKCKNRVKK